MSSVDLVAVPRAAAGIGPASVADRVHSRSVGGDGDEMLEVLLPILPTARKLFLLPSTVNLQYASLDRLAKNTFR